MFEATIDSIHVKEIKEKHKRKKISKKSEKQATTSILNSYAKVWNIKYFILNVLLLEFSLKFVHLFFEMFLGKCVFILHLIKIVLLILMKNEITLV